MTQNVTCHSSLWRVTEAAISQIDVIAHWPFLWPLYSMHWPYGLLHWPLYSMHWPYGLLHWPLYSMHWPYGLLRCWGHSQVLSLVCVFRREWEKVNSIMDNYTLHYTTCSQVNSNTSSASVFLCLWFYQSVYLLICLLFWLSIYLSVSMCICLLQYSSVDVFLYMWLCMIILLTISLNFASYIQFFFLLVTILFLKVFFVHLHRFYHYHLVCECFILIQFILMNVEIGCY